MTAWGVGLARAINVLRHRGAVLTRGLPAGSKTTCRCRSFESEIVRSRATNYGESSEDWAVRAGYAEGCFGTCRMSRAGGCGAMRVASPRVSRSVSRSGIAGIGVGVIRSRSMLQTHAGHAWGHSTGVQSASAQLSAPCGSNTASPWPSRSETTMTGRSRRIATVYQRLRAMVRRAAGYGQAGHSWQSSATPSRRPREG